MPKIMPITVLRDTTEISNTYHQDVYRKLAVAENQIANGEVLDAETALEDLRVKYEY